MTKPLILVSNDDGIRSPGLAAAVDGVSSLGDVLIVAPKRQQSSSGRAFYWNERSGRKYRFRIRNKTFAAYAVDASPAVSVRYGIQLIATRRPDLVVSGINYGENLGNGLTISGTVGAALEASAEGIPALAISLETAKEFHTTHSKRVDFATAAYFTRRFASKMLAIKLPREASLLNVNVPNHATRRTGWRLTRASGQAYFQSIVNRGRFVGYDVKVDLDNLEPDSDIYAVLVDHIVSATPLTFDLTARLQLPQVRAALGNGKL